ncbi:hypothetical protein HD596_004842 [Nonomuraea jabiensis]|uniref:Uncharacterized protein n=1 Tax=Nonomuraea jabiensis TaxID=882448 RepID=A0A7W9G6M8_9ACTN|nr:hypothetical protein [Nonomuraea jabiensis]
MRDSGKHVREYVDGWLGDAGGWVWRWMIF